MNSLFKNAIESIQLGVEDFKASDPRRALSAICNFYAGTLLPAKEVLVRRAPKANPRDVIGTRFKPVLDKGDIKFEAAANRTIDFEEIGQRFKDFGLPIDRAALLDLNKMRNDIEHHYTSVTRKAVREAIAKAFPVVVDLFRLAGEEPRTALGDVWEDMLEARDLYERELAECRKTFEGVNWKSESMAKATPCCPKCDSLLVARVDTSTNIHDYADAECRMCGEKISAINLIETALDKYFEAEGYAAAREGAPRPLHACPECSVKAYVTWEEENACAWCDLELGECLRCETQLTPDDVAWDNNEMCSYCDHIMSKDD